MGAFGGPINQRLPDIGWIDSAHLCSHERRPRRRPAVRAFRLHGLTDKVVPSKPDQPERWETSAGINLKSGERGRATRLNFKTLLISTFPVTVKRVTCKRYPLDANVSSDL